MHFIRKHALFIPYQNAIRIFNFNITLFFNKKNLLKRNNLKKMTKFIKTKSD